MTIHRPGRSVGQSVGHTGEGHYVLAVAACLNVSRLGLSMSPSSVFTSPVAALLCALGLLVREETGCTFSREKGTHLTG